MMQRYNRNNFDKKLRGEKPCESVPNDRCVSKHCTVQDLTVNMEQRNLLSSEQQKLADSIIKKSEHLIDETRAKTEQCKVESEFRLKERLQNIEYLLDEVAKQKTNVCLEEDALKTYCQRLMNALQFVIKMKKKNDEQIAILEEKPNDVHLTNDEIDKELKWETNIIVSAESHLEKALGQASEQLRLLRSTIYALDHELSNKSSSLHIDMSNLTLNNNQKQLEYRREFAVQPYTTSQVDWEKSTHQMVTKTTKEIASSVQMRTYFDVLMTQVIEDISKQFYRVSEFVRKRICEYRHAKKLLEEVQKQSAQKINDINANVVALEKELYEKEGYVRLCQMRLGNRADRPMAERCDDRVEATLLKEFRTLRETVVNLDQMIAESTAAQRCLLKAQILQDEELNRKTNMLKLYEVDCMSIRDSIDFQLF